jgi:hypothetical protein
MGSARIVLSVISSSSSDGGHLPAAQQLADFVGEVDVQEVARGEVDANTEVETFELPGSALA